jgi:thymidylate synthase (FAD)
MSELIGKKYAVLDSGFVSLVDYMGDDAAICEAARISYGKGTKSVSDDRTLIRYLMRHGHTSPFEMAEIKLHVRVPMDTWRQWIRHRTASVNEYSTRYSEAIDAMQATAPDAWRLQATDNKQGSESGGIDWPSGEIADACMNAFGDDVTAGQYLSTRELALQRLSRAVYQERLAAGVAREQARKDLPLSTYTEAVWKCDLHNVLGFLRQRLDPHAQEEIQDYARVIGRIVQELFPITWEAFRDYRIESVTLSRLDVRAIESIVGGLSAKDTLATFGNAREREECRQKLIRLGIINS